MRETVRQAASGWWTDSVIYQIYPRSFWDSNGDGIGDLRGIYERLDYLRWLGVDAIWLSPPYRSPMADFGYDISDHCDIDPIFGDLADFDRLVDGVHSRGLRLVVDYVANHTSSGHRWFQAAHGSRDSPERERYVWRDPAPSGGPPNNWRRAFSEEPAWTLDETTGQYYLHLFLPEQPDLNWSDPRVRQDMSEVLRFWMGRGVDGFRADVIHCIGKPDDLPCAPEDLAGLPACIFDQGPGTHDCLRMLRRVIDGDAPGEHLFLGETAVFDRDQQLSYLGDGDELHLGFNFLALHTRWDATAWRSELEATYAAYERAGAWPTWVLSNHDVPRHATRYGTESRARAAAVLLLTQRGTPFMYQGEELGLFDASIAAQDRLDPGGRDGCRAPIPWSAQDTGGWSEQMWLPPPPDAARMSVEAQRDDPGSILTLYGELLAMRRRLPVLRSGRIELLEAPQGVLRYRRWIDGRAGDRTVVEVAVNFAPEPVGDAVSEGEVLVGTHGRSDVDAPPGSAVPGTSLRADEARVVAL
ncbi:MAG: alpha-amylase family glycosyl hydrolase [Microthrixaceae bacterium]